MGFVVGDVYHASQRECAEHVRSLLRGIGVTERMGMCPVSAAHVRYFYELCLRAESQDRRKQPSPSIGLTRALFAGGLVPHGPASDSNGV
jgi:hypothetical protein